MMSFPNFNVFHSTNICSPIFFFPLKALDNALHFTGMMSISVPCQQGIFKRLLLLFHIQCGLTLEETVNPQMCWLLTDTNTLYYGIFFFVHFSFLPGESLFIFLGYFLGIQGFSNVMHFC